MKRIIHHIRGRREETRRHILHFLTLVFALVLFSFWVFSLGGNSTKSSLNTDKEKADELAPFSVLKANIVDGYKGVSNQEPESEIELDILE